MRQARAGHDTRGQRVTPRCRWARARPGFEATRREKLAARTARGRVATHRHTQRPDTTGVEGAGGPVGLAAVPVGGGRAWPDNESTRRAKLTARTAHGRVATHRHTQRPGTTGVEGVGGSGGHGRASRRRTQPHTATRRRRRGGRRRVRRARAGFEIDHSKPSGSRVAISRAAGPNGARNTRGATSNTSRKAAAHGNNQQPGPTTHHAARQHTTRRHKQHSTGARARRPAPLDATTQTRVLRSTCVPCRSARAARQWRRSSHSPHLRRRAGPRR